MTRHCYCYDEARDTCTSITVWVYSSGGPPLKHLGKTLKTNSENSLQSSPSVYCPVHQQFGALETLMDNRIVGRGQSSGRPRVAILKPNNLIFLKLSHLCGYQVLPLRGCHIWLGSLPNIPWLSNSFAITSGDKYNMITSILHIRELRQHIFESCLAR